MVYEHLFESLPQSSGTFLDMELWCQTVNMRLTFQGTTQLFGPLYTATAMFEGLNFSISSAVLVNVHLFN